MSYVTDTHDFRDDEKRLLSLFLSWPLPMMMVQFENAQTQASRHYLNDAWRTFVAGFSPEGIDASIASLIDRPHPAQTKIDTWSMTSGERHLVQLSWQPISLSADYEAFTLASSSNATPNAMLLWLEDLTPSHGAETPDFFQVNRIKDEFLACVSHELRSPLTALLGLSKLLQDPLVGELNDRQRRYVQLIHRSGKQLISIVNDILDLTRMETGHLDLHPTSVDLAVLCQQALEQVQHHSPDAIPDAPEPIGPSFVLQIEPGLEKITADSNRLQQMLRHLFSNALKFTANDGHAGLRVNHWEGWIAFTVWDTGIGIPADKQHLIFQKFQQLENPMTRQFEGTGLGLVLTQRLARLHGGDITFTSHPGKGSEFTLLLPPMPIEALPHHPITPSPPTIPSPISTDLRLPVTLSHPELTTKPPLEPFPAEEFSNNHMVLVVEASLRNLEDLTEQLTELNYRVAIARSGTEALEKARKLRPCAILLNPFLPILSGWDVLTLLKSDPTTRQIPLIVTATRAEQERAYRASANGFLRIPVSPRSLLLMLERVTASPTKTPSPVMDSEDTTRTILCLYLQEPALVPTPLANQSEKSPAAMLQANHYRVIEAYDIDQAEMLARVWKPHAVVLVGVQSLPSLILQQLAQHTYLASLPIVTLDPSLSQTAKQVPDLAIFPCSSMTTHPKMVLQTVEAAIGFGGQPLVLLVDSAQWAERRSKAQPLIPSEWLQALMQYLQTAGLRGRIVREIKNISYPMRSQWVDLLLVYWQDGTSLEALQQGITDLLDVTRPPAVMVLDYRSAQHSQAKPDVNKLEPPLDYPVISHPENMTLLLQQIQQYLFNNV